MLPSLHPQLTKLVPHHSLGLPLRLCLGQKPPHPLMSPHLRPPFWLPLPLSLASTVGISLIALQLSLVPPQLPPDHQVLIRQQYTCLFLQLLM